MELAWPEFLVSLGALQRLQPDYDPEQLGGIQKASKWYPNG
jgi:hypothetical protein